MSSVNVNHSVLQLLNNVGVTILQVEFRIH